MFAIGKILIWSGWILLVIGTLLILIGYIGIISKAGLSGFQQIISHFNIMSFFSVLLTLAPGLTIKRIGNKIINRYEKI